MKISFSTLGCPDFSWIDIYSMAKDFGFDGIEVRGIGAALNAADAQPFQPRFIDRTKAKLDMLGLSIPCISTGTSLHQAEKRGAALREIEAAIVLCQKLGAPFIRILADTDAAPDGEMDDADVIETMRALGADAAKAGVTLLIETNGVYADTARLRKVLDQIDSVGVAALWDMHHPYRFFAEQPEDTINNLGSYIRHCHVKDSVMVSGQPEYRLMGEGDLPVPDMLNALKDTGYEGYVSLEWVKRWAPQLQYAGIVFPHFANYMRPWRTAGGMQQTPGGGKYPFKKEQLISHTFPEVLETMAREFPDQLAFKYTTHHYTRTYAQFKGDVDAFARSLIAMGVGRGDHVAIWATNVPAWFITFWATVEIGAVLVTVNTAYKIHEAEYLLRQSDTHTLVVTDGVKGVNYVDIINQLCPELKASKPGQLSAERLPRLKNVVTVDSVVDGCYSWEEAQELAETVPMAEVHDRMRKINPDDVCNMQYTSGTTGFPKGVMLTHRNVVNNGKAIGDCMNFSTDDRLLIHVPMFHCFGLVLAMTASMTHGTSMYPIPAFSPRQSLAVIHAEQITACHGVPTMFIAMLEHPDFEKTDFSHMRTGIMAGSPCPVKVMEDVLTKMHMPEICITYGQTEASPGCTMSKTTDSIDVRVSTVGGPIFGVECKITDPETGEELGDEMDGEFCARGYNVMKGYYKMPEATAAAIDSEGFLHTGDLARRTKDGNYKITGRIKDMIIRGGENIYPKEIEEFLYTHDKVKDVQVIGVPDEQYGEQIMACVIVKEGVECTEAEVRGVCMARMAKHKCPKYCECVTEFPMNAAGKILKYRMREAAVEKLGLQKAAKIVTA